MVLNSDNLTSKKLMLCPELFEEVTCYLGRFKLTSDLLPYRDWINYTESVVVPLREGEASQSLGKIVRDVVVFGHKAFIAKGTGRKLLWPKPRVTGRMLEADDPLRKPLGEFFIYLAKPP